MVGRDNSTVLEGIELDAATGRQVVRTSVESRPTADKQEVAEQENNFTTSLCTFCTFLEALNVRLVEWKLYFCVALYNSCEIIIFVRQ